MRFTERRPALNHSTEPPTPLHEEPDAKQELATLRGVLGCNRATMAVYCRWRYGLNPKGSLDVFPDDWGGMRALSDRVLFDWHLSRLRLGQGEMDLTKKHGGPSKARVRQRVVRPVIPLPLDGGTGSHKEEIPSGLFLTKKNARDLVSELSDLTIEDDLFHPDVGISRLFNLLLRFYNFCTPEKPVRDILEVPLEQLSSAKLRLTSAAWFRFLRSVRRSGFTSKEVDEGDLRDGDSGVIRHNRTLNHRIRSSQVQVLDFPYLPETLQTQWQHDRPATYATLARMAILLCRMSDCAEVDGIYGSLNFSKDFGTTRRKFRVYAWAHMPEYLRHLGIVDLAEEDLAEYRFSQVRAERLLREETKTRVEGELAARARVGSITLAAIPQVVAKKVESELAKARAEKHAREYARRQGRKHLTVNHLRMLANFHPFAASSAIFKACYPLRVKYTQLEVQYLCSCVEITRVDTRLTTDRKVFDPVAKRVVRGEDGKPLYETKEIAEGHLKKKGHFVDHYQKYTSAGEHSPVLTEYIQWLRGTYFSTLKPRRELPVVAAGDPVEIAAMLNEDESARGLSHRAARKAYSDFQKRHPHFFQSSAETGDDFEAWLDRPFSHPKRGIIDRYPLTQNIEPCRISLLAFMTFSEAERIDLTRAWSGQFYSEMGLAALADEEIMLTEQERKDREALEAAEQDALFNKMIMPAGDSNKEFKQ